MKYLKISILLYKSIYKDSESRFKKGSSRSTNRDFNTKYSNLTQKYHVLKKGLITRNIHGYLPLCFKPLPPCRHIHVYLMPEILTLARDRVH